MAKISPMYRILGFGDQLNGATEPTICWIQGVAKRYESGAKHVLNELIANRIGMCLGLPLPPGEIAVDDDQKPHFVSMFFGPEGETPPPADFAEVARDFPFLACGIVAFDLFVGNDDRHAQNLAYDPDNGIDLVIFDHSEAVFGPFADAGRILSLMTNNSVASMPLAEEIRSPEYFHEWFGRVESLRLREVLGLPLQRLVSYGLLSKDENDALFSFLEYRQKQLRIWITEYGELRYQNWSPL